MKKTFTKSLFLIILLGFGYLKGYSQGQDAKEKMTAEIAQNAEAIFEGKVVEKTGSFITEQGEIYTTYKVTVETINYGKVENSVITLVKLGGKFGEKEAYVSDGSMLFMNQLSTIIIDKTNKVIDANTKNSYYVLEQIGYDENWNIISSGQKTYPYKSYEEFYNDLGKKVKGLKFEKKSPITPKTGSIEKLIPEIGIEKVSYALRKKNYEALLAYNKQRQLIAQKNKLNSPQNVQSNDLTLQLSNGTVTGTVQKYYEFDVNVKCNNGSTFLDGTDILLSYNTQIFGDSIVKDSTIQVTNGTAFNTSGYIPFNMYMLDGGNGTAAIGPNSNYNQSNPVRTKVTTSFQQLAHVKILIKHCGHATTVGLINASVALNFCYFTTIANDNSSNISPYDNLLYSGAASTAIACTPTIIDFNTHLRGGVDTLKIIGYGFGNTQGSGSVSFHDADISGFPYTTSLDSPPDYVVWNDSIIKIKIPSIINAMTSNGVNNTVGTGAFKITNASSQTITSSTNLHSQTFVVDYSLFARLFNSKKIRANLVGNQAGGSYTVYVDTAIGHSPQKFNIVKKAARDWACLTSMNFVIVFDPSVTGPTSNNNFISLDNFTSGSNLLGVTTTYVGNCSTTLHELLTNFKMSLRKNETWSFDTTGAVLPANTADFYEIVSHELGHAMGLQHIIDYYSLMYFKGQDSTNAVPGALRRHVKAYTEEVAAGIYQVAQSNSTVSSGDLSGCNYRAITPNNSGSCFATAIAELAAQKFNLNVYPNPSSGGNLNIEFNSIEGANGKIQIYDVLGKSVYENDLKYLSNTNNNIELNTNQFSSGLYIIKLSLNNYSTSQKIIIQ